MIKKRSLILSAACIICFIVIAVMLDKPSPNDRLAIALSAVQSANGWGYEIAVDGKTFIHQSYIPAIEGNIAFATKEQALFVGRQAILKLRNGRLPQITLSELKKWGVIKGTPF